MVGEAKSCLVNDRAKKRILVMSEIGHSWSPVEALGGFTEVTKHLPRSVTLGSVLIGTIIKAAGYEVDFLDNHSEALFDMMLRERLSRRPDAICLSTTFILHRGRLEEIVRMIREVCPSVPLILGGASLVSDPSMAELGDFSVPGDGENVVVPLLDAIFSGRGVSPGQIAGVSPGSFQGGLYANIAYDVNLDDVIWPDWSLATRLPNEFFPLETQRGCRWRCTFCNFPTRAGNKMRYRSVDGVIREMIRNYEVFGIHRYVFADSTFNSPPDRCIELLRKIKELPFPVEWVGYARVDAVTPEQADLMRESGCKDLFLGLESGDDFVLKKMNKGFTVDKMRAGIRLLRERDISFTSSWLIGFPGETRDSARRTQDLMLEVKSPHNAIHCFQFSELSPVAKAKEKYGIEPGEGSCSWRHESMAYEEAHEYYLQTTEMAVQNDLFLTSGFCAGKYGALGFSIPEIAELTGLEHVLFKNRVSRNHAFEAAERKIAPWVERVKRESMQHPMAREAAAILV